MFVHRFLPLLRETPGVAYHTAKLWVCVIYFPVHCVGVTNVLPMIIYLPPSRCVTEIGVRDLAVPAKTTTDLLMLLFAVDGN